MKFYSWISRIYNQKYQNKQTSGATWRIKDELKLIRKNTFITEYATFEMKNAKKKQTNSAT